MLVPDVALGHVIVPSAAIRDEGTSYHYLPPAREVEPTRQAFDAIVATLERHHVPHVTGKTWTTDGLYRETRGKVERRVAEGCLTVEMEAAAFFAVAAFRGPRSDNSSTRATTSRVTHGTTVDGTRTPEDASSCSAWRPKRAWSFPPASHILGFGILRA